MIEYSSLNEDFIIKKFPELKQQVLEEMDGFNEFLPHVIFGNVFNQLLVNLLKQHDYLNSNLIERIFTLYEELSEYGDEETKNLVQVTLLEYLWDEKVTFDRAYSLIGNHTRKLWDNIYLYLYKP